MARVRAVADDEKLSKRHSILDATFRLFMDNTNELPSMSAIAKASGLAKGTLYLYFRAKEEIFLALLEESFGRMLDGVQGVLAVRQESTAGFIGAFLGGYLGVLRGEPSFLRLASMTNSVLEQNLDPEIAVKFKKQLAVRLQDIGSMVETSLPHLGKGEGAKLLLHVYAITIGLWQVLDCSKKIRSMLDDEIFSVLLADYFEELPIVLGQTLKGKLAG